MISSPDSQSILNRTQNTYYERDVPECFRSYTQNTHIATLEIAVLSIHEIPSSKQAVLCTFDQ